MKGSDLTGLKFGRWTVTGKGEGEYWHCSCTCGQERLVHRGTLTRGRSKSCGCLRSEMIAQRCGLKLEGYQTDTFTVIRQLAKDSSGNRLWECRCFCGNLFTSHSARIKRTASLTCGCLWRQRVSNGRKATSRWKGLSSHPLYSIWSGMIRRCYDSTDTAYRNYGGRGITVCDRWHNPSDFIADMSPRPAGTSIDRIDNNKGYSPENCKWSTRAEQNRNRRDTIMITMAGVTLPLITWCEIYGQSRNLVYERIKDSGWDVWEALVIPRLLPAVYIPKIKPVRSYS